MKRKVQTSNDFISGVINQERNLQYQPDVPVIPGLLGQDPSTWTPSNIFAPDTCETDIDTAVDTLFDIYNEVEAGKVDPAKLVQ